MHLPARFRLILIAPLIAILATSVSAQNADPSRTVRVTGIVRDEANAIPLPGIPVEVVDTKEVVYTDVDGRYVVELAPGDRRSRS